jgi:hypothetical protein
MPGSPGGRRNPSASFPCTAELGRTQLRKHYQVTQPACQSGRVDCRGQAGFELTELAHLRLPDTPPLSDAFTGPQLIMGRRQAAPGEQIKFYYPY